MIEIDQRHHATYTLLLEQEKTETLFLLLCRIYFLTIKWQSCLMHSIVQRFCFGISKFDELNFDSTIKDATAMQNLMEILPVCKLRRKKQSFIAKNTITCSSGGTVHYKNRNTQITMSFPPDSLKEPSLLGSIEVLGNDCFYHKEQRNGNKLAGPVVCLGPSGSSFKKDVQVTIPLPNGEIFMQSFSM